MDSITNANLGAGNGSAREHLAPWKISTRRAMCCLIWYPCWSGPVPTYSYRVSVTRKGWKSLSIMTGVATDRHTRRKTRRCPGAWGRVKALPTSEIVIWDRRIRFARAPIVQWKALPREKRAQQSGRRTSHARGAMRYTFLIRPYRIAPKRPSTRCTIRAAAHDLPSISAWGEVHGFIWGTSISTGGVILRGVWYSAI